jgi:hypothetical protein
MLLCLPLPGAPDKAKNYYTTRNPPKAPHRLSLACLGLRQGKAKAALTVTLGLREAMARVVVRRQDPHAVSPSLQRHGGIHHQLLRPACSFVNWFVDCLVGMCMGSIGPNTVNGPRSDHRRWTEKEECWARVPMPRSRWRKATSSDDASGVGCVPWIDRLVQNRCAPTALGA